MNFIRTLLWHELMIRFEKNQLHFQLLSHFHRITHNMTRVKLQAPKIKSFCSSESFPFITPRNSSLSLLLWLVPEMFYYILCLLLTRGGNVHTSVSFDKRIMKIAQFFFALSGGWWQRKHKWHAACGVSSTKGEIIGCYDWIAPLSHDGPLKCNAYQFFTHFDD